MSNGFVAYQGPSEIDGKPIKAVVTGTTTPSANVKTGDMLQLFIMPMASKPSDAIRNGDDASVCGDCVHRPSVAKTNGKAACYVEVGKSVNAVYKAQYPLHAEAKRKPPIRLGAWGEPTAMPFETVARLTTDGHTGYTHQWRTCDPRFKQYLMASVDSAAEYAQATAIGWRTFRVRKHDAPTLENESVCPASKEGGQRVQCDSCGLCKGATIAARNIVIADHGLMDSRRRAVAG